VGKNLRVPEQLIITLANEIYLYDFMEVVMNNQIIFYGAGPYAENTLEKWISKGMEPVCFADKDENKHYKFMKTSYGGGGGV
jgi:hypothetical protein